MCFNYLIINYLLYFLTHVLNAISSKKIKFGDGVKLVSFDDGTNGRYHRCLIQRPSSRAGEEIRRSPRATFQQAADML